VTREGPSAGGLADLYMRHLPGAIGLAYLILADRGLAEDIAQEAFVRLAGRFGHLRAPEAFDAYLKKTVANLCISHLRHQRVEASYLARQRTRVAPPPEPVRDLALREELWDEMLRLPVRQRAAIVLRYYEDLPERTVAEILGLSVPAVRSLVSRGMESLRARIRGEDGA
jgi:RNA polymerase sigma-70 factor (sigma-E family)